MATKTFLTIDEFLRLPDSDGDQDVQYELVEGELVSMSPGMLRHNLVRDKVVITLRPFVEQHQLGTVVSEQAFHLFGTTVRVPDVAFIRTGRELADDKPIKGAPDLAIEVISPTNTPREIDQRISDFFRAGCKRVWVIYPEHREVYVHGLAGVKRLTENEALQDTELLPEFSMIVATIFEEPK